MELSRLRLNPDEVEQLIVLRLADLCHPDAVGHTQFLVSPSSSLLLLYYLYLNTFSFKHPPS